MPTYYTADDLLYHQDSTRKRNLTVLPCDNGRFTPNFRFLVSGSAVINPQRNDPKKCFVDDNGVLDLSLVSLNDMVSSDYDMSALDNSAIVDQVYGVTPEFCAKGLPTNELAVYGRTADPTSNESTFFDISNMFYGSSIQPGSFQVKDPCLTGSGGPVKVTLRDDGHGNLYRCDAAGEHAKWATVGNIIYADGLVVVKDPTLPRYGVEGYEMSFNGVQNVHVMKYHLVAPPGKVNSSSNPSFQVTSASADANDTDPQFVYLTGYNIHDENLNIIAKGQLAQPVVKRANQGVKIISRIDW